MVLVPVLGARLSLVLGCLLYTLSPVLTYLCLVTRWIILVSTISTYIYNIY